MIRFIRLLLRTLAPLSVIAKELTVMRELYELEMQSRPDALGGPVIRITEEAKEGMTEIFYAGEDKPKRKAWFGRTVDETDESEDD